MRKKKKGQTSKKKSTGFDEMEICEVLERRKLVKCYKKKEFSKINKKFRCNFFPFSLCSFIFFLFFFVVVYFLFLFVLFYFIFLYFLSFFCFLFLLFPFLFLCYPKTKINQTKNKPIKPKQNQYKKLFHTFLSQKSFLKSLQCSRCNLISRSFSRPPSP